MDDAVVEAVIRFKAENMAAVAEARSALSGVSNGVSGVNVSVLNSASAAKTAERDLVSEGGNVARAFGSVGAEGEKAFSRIAAAAGSITGAGPMGLAIGAGLLGIGLASAGAKDAIDNSEKLESSTKSLEQAYQSQGQTLQNNGRWVQDFLGKNKQYIDDQYAARDAIASVVRSGLNESEVQRVANDAIDLAALKHISYAQAVDALNQAEHGRMRGLIDLGVTTTQYTDANGDLVQSQHSVRDSMKEVDDKVKGGRDSISKLDQSSHDLHASWQNLSAKAGPDLSQELGRDAESLANVLDWTNKNSDKIGGLYDAMRTFASLGSNKVDWSNFFGGLGSWLDSMSRDADSLFQKLGALPSGGNQRAMGRGGATPTLSSSGPSPFSRNRGLP